MAGGIWTSQNKRMPGVYINTKSNSGSNTSVGERGIVAIAEPLSFGPSGIIQTIIPGEDIKPYIGYDITSDQALFLREMMKGSDVTSGPSKIFLYRPVGSGGAKASATVGDLVVSALYDGTRGNDIAVSVQGDPDSEGIYTVSTMVDGYIVDDQAVGGIDALTDNAWVTFKKSGSGNSLTGTAGATLTGGKNPAVSATDYSDFLKKLEPCRFDILAYDGTESTVIQAMAAFVKRVSNNVGQKCQVVMAGDVAANCNSELVIAVENGVELDDGSRLTAQQAVWWLAGAEAGALYNKSLTYAQYPNAVEASPKLSSTQAEAAAAAGKICFIGSAGKIRVCTDINTLSSFTVEKGQEFSKNRVMRVLMQFNNDTFEHFSDFFIGKVDNNDAGRNLLKGWIVGYLNEMQANSGIKNFTADDVSVTDGNSIDSVVINVSIQPVDSIEKIYMTIMVSVNTAV